MLDAKEVLKREKLHLQALLKNEEKKDPNSQFSKNRAKAKAARKARKKNRK